MDQINPLIIRANGSSASASRCVLRGPRADQGGSYSKSIYTESLRKGHREKKKGKKNHTEKHVTGETDDWIRQDPGPVFLRYL